MYLHHLAHKSTWGYCLPDTTLQAICHAWRVLLVKQLGILPMRQSVPCIYRVTSVTYFVDDKCAILPSRSYVFSVDVYILSFTICPMMMILLL